MSYQDQVEPFIAAAALELASKYGSPFQVVRPNYSLSNAPESIIFGSMNYRADPGSKWADPRIPGVTYYEIVGNRQARPGDVLIPLSTTSSVIQTVISMDSGKPCYTAKTDMIGKITNGADDDSGVVYSNIRFSFFTLPTVGDGLDSTLLGSLGAGIKRVVMYNRPGLIQGMWLRWTEPGVVGSNTTITKAMQITATDGKNLQLILNVKENPGGT